MKYPLGDQRLCNLLLYTISQILQKSLTNVDVCICFFYALLFF